MEQPLRAEFAVHAGDPPQHYNIGGLLDLGGLLGALVVTTEELGEGIAPGSLKVEAVRTHEWELVVAIVSVVGAPFVTGLMQELGKRLAGWLAGEAARIRGRFGESVPSPLPGPPEIRSASGDRVVVDADDPDVAEAAGRLLEAAAKQNLRVELVVEPAAATG
jgi:hypothetical protein